MSRISVIEFTQQLDGRPLYFTSRKIAEAIVGDKKAEWCIPKRRIHLLTNICWATLRLTYKEVSICRGRKVTEVAMPQLNKEDAGDNRRCMMLHYPPTDQTSYIKANFNRIWGSNQRKQAECQN